MTFSKQCPVKNTGRCGFGGEVMSGEKPAFSRGGIDTEGVHGIGHGIVMAAHGMDTSATIVISSRYPRLLWSTRNGPLVMAQRLGHMAFHHLHRAHPAVLHRIL